MGKSNVIKKESSEFYQTFDELHKEIVRDDTERFTLFTRSRELTKKIFQVTERTLRCLSDKSIRKEPDPEDRMPGSGAFHALAGERKKPPEPESRPVFDILGRDDIIERASLMGAILGRGISEEEYDYIEENWKSVFKSPGSFLESEHIASLIEEGLKRDLDRPEDKLFSPDGSGT
ncbi:MAG: hypothetical protein K6F35_09790 [Lachnospiraceae bacterium]|nr:hypothetical protein [Lachnospiraceae bacterium]